MAEYLVTGGAGFIGSRIATRLIELGHQVHIADDVSSGNTGNVPAGATFQQLDLAQPEAWDQLPARRFDAVFHLAAQASGEGSFDDPYRDCQVNMAGTVLLAGWCLRRGIDRLLFASSMAVYGDVDDNPVREDHVCRPKSFYAAAKLASEAYLRIFQDRGLNVTMLRMFNVYGPGQNLANMSQGMVSIYLAYLLRKETLLVKGSVERFRDLIYVDDVVSGWLAALDNRASWGKTYNLGTGRPTRVHELVQCLIRAFGYPADYPTEILGSTPGDQFGVYGDISLIQADLGWAPRTDLASGVQQMVSWARQA